MKNVTINFADMWFKFNPVNNIFYTLLRKYFNVTISEKPDFLIYSCYGLKHTRFSDCIKIFWSDENVRPDFNECDYAITYDRINFLDRHVRRQVGTHKPPLSDGIDYISRKFCNFVYSNSTRGKGCQIREDFCRKLAQYKHVDCPGKVLNNMKDAIEPRLGNWRAGKNAFISNYKFTIAFENDSSSGYITEKLRDPFEANSIPIYWGAPDVAIDFNPKSFINCHAFTDFDSVIDYIIYLDTHDSAYMEMMREPAMQSDYNFDLYDLERNLVRIIETGQQQPKDERGAFWATTNHCKRFLANLGDNIITPLNVNKSLDEKKILDDILSVPYNKQPFLTIETRIRELAALENLVTSRGLGLLNGTGADTAERAAVHAAGLLKSAAARLTNKQTAQRFRAMDDRGAEDKYRQIFAMLRPQEPRGARMTRIGSNQDGGYVMLDPGRDGIAYSFGIGGTASWDTDMANRNFRVFQFDGTVASSPCSNANIRFFRKNITSASQHGEDLISLPEIFSLLKHENESNIILQMDIEGSEWEFFENISEQDLSKFSQIVVEFHWMTGLKSLDRWQNVFRKILKTHIPTHLHYNNCGETLLFTNFIVSSLWEVSFARRDMNAATPSRRLYPTELDYPNLPHLPEIFIGDLDIIVANPHNDPYPA